MDKKLQDIEEIFSSRGESDLFHKVINLTSCLILAAVNSDEPTHFSQAQEKISSYPPPPLAELIDTEEVFKNRGEINLLNEVINYTSRLILAAVHFDEPTHFSQAQKKISCNPHPTAGNQPEVAICSWTGELPARIHRYPKYSSKVFLGGIPRDATEFTLLDSFDRFGTIMIEWPDKYMQNQPKGHSYCYVIMESPKRVKSLINHCKMINFNWYYKISSRRMKSKEVVIIPWEVSDTNYPQVSPKLDLHKTVFVGGLHGLINARALANIMNDLFGGVIYAGLNIDYYKYPIGSARVTFDNSSSYMKAVNAAFIEIKTSQFTKKVQVNPYLEDSPCSFCSSPGVYFCREIVCFSYYCQGCWDLHHSTGPMHSHRCISRNSKKFYI